MTLIKDQRLFLVRNETKDSLTLFLAQHLIEKCSANVVTATRASIVKNHECTVTSVVSTQEEADTMMIMHAVEVAGLGYNVHIYSPDSDVLLLALRRVPLLGNEAALIMGTGGAQRKILIKPIFDKLGPERATALINWHALKGCDTTGHIQGKGKKGCFTSFLEASQAVLDALSKLGEDEEPSDAVIKGCEEFLCKLFCGKGMNIKEAKDLRWYLFKQLKADQGVEKLPPTPGAWAEHVRRAHLQARIWHQDLVAEPVRPDPLKLGWEEKNDRLMPVLSKVAAAPEFVLQLVRCNCGAKNFESSNKCAGRCSCKSSNLVCTELCSCQGDPEKCVNLEPFASDVERDGYTTDSAPIVLGLVGLTQVIHGLSARQEC